MTMHERARMPTPESARGAGGGPDAVAAPAGRAARRGRGTMVGAGREAAAAPRAADPALRGGQHLGDQQVAAGAHLGELVPLGLGHEVDRAQLQGLQGDVGPFLRQGADHHHRHLVHRQERRQRLQARDLGHLDVERDHVRLEPQRPAAPPRGRRAPCRRPRSPAPSRAGPTAAGASAPSRPRSGRAPGRASRLRCSRSADRHGGPRRSGACRASMSRSRTLQA